MTLNKVDINTGPLTGIEFLVISQGTLFVGLKLANQITWSWLWVLSPYWIPVAFLLGLATLVSLCYLLYHFTVFLISITWIIIKAAWKYIKGLFRKDDIHR